MTDLDEYRNTARRWLADNLPPRIDGPPPEYTREFIDSQRPIQRLLHDAGYAGITWAPEYGGQGLSAEHQAVFAEEAAAYALPDFGQAAITTGTCLKTLAVHASEEFKRQHLPRIFRGDELWIQFLSEPQAGSDLASVQTRATRDGDGWRLDGAKVWTTFGHLADWGICIARTSWDVPKHRGLTWFAIPTDAPGLTIRPIRQITGDAEFCEELLDGVVVPDSDRIGDVDDGWAVTTTMLTFERGADREGDRDGGVQVRDTPGDLAPDLVDLALSTGRAYDPVVRQLIGTIHGNDFLLSQLSRRVTARMRDGGDPSLASLVKLARGRFDPDRSLATARIARGAIAGWTIDGPGADAAWTYLDGRRIAIAAGTNEMQRNAIGERLLGLPREPSFDRDKPFAQVLRDASSWTTTNGSNR